MSVSLYVRGQLKRPNHKPYFCQIFHQSYNFGQNYMHDWIMGRILAQKQTKPFF